MHINARAMGILSLISLIVSVVTFFAGILFLAGVKTDVGILCCIIVIQISFILAILADILQKMVGTVKNTGITANNTFSLVQASENKADFETDGDE